MCILAYIEHGAGHTSHTYRGAETYDMLPPGSRSYGKGSQGLHQHEEDVHVEDITQVASQEGADQTAGRPQGEHEGDVLGRGGGPNLQVNQTGSRHTVRCSLWKVLISYQGKVG